MTYETLADFEEEFDRFIIDEEYRTKEVQEAFNAQKEEYKDLFPPEDLDYHISITKKDLEEMYNVKLK